MEELNTAIEAGTSDGVKLWRNWMGVIFYPSILFVWKSWAARFALISFLLTMVFGIGIWMMTKNIHLLGLPHLVLWIPLAVFVFRRVLTHSTATSGNYSGFLALAHYGWAALLFATIAISLVFDVRDVALVLFEG